MYNVYEWHHKELVMKRISNPRDRMSQQSTELVVYIYDDQYAQYPRKLPCLCMKRYFFGIRVSETIAWILIKCFIKCVIYLNIHSCFHASAGHSSIFVDNYMDHSGCGLGRWEEALLCNAFSHWPSPYLEWSLHLWWSWTNPILSTLNYF